MKAILARFAGLVLFAGAALAGDYVLIRDAGTMPGGTTNTAKVYPRPSGFGGEVIEFQAWSGGADTATLYRVSSDAGVTNTLAVLSLPGPSIAVLTATNTVTAAGGANDYLLIVGTGTNKFKHAEAWRAHAGF